MNQKGFSIIFLMISIIAFCSVLAIIYLYYNKNSTYQRTQTTIKSTQGYPKGLDKEFLSNAIVIVKDKEIMLVNALNTAENETVFTANRCDSLESLKWSPDKSKIAFHINHYLLKDNKCFSNITGFELNYIDLGNKRLVTVHSGKEQEVYGNTVPLGSFFWKGDSTSLFFSVLKNIWEFNVTSEAKKSIRVLDSYKDNFFSPRYMVGEEFYGAGATYIGKINVANQTNITTLVDEKLPKDQFDPGWGATISDFAISPDGGKMIYELNLPLGHSIVLMNLKKNSKKQVITLCKEPVQNNFPYGIGEFSPDSSMFSVNYNCSKDYNLLLFGANGDLLKRFIHNDTKKLISETNTNGYSEDSYGTKFSSFSNDSKKIFLLNEKKETNGDKTNPMLLLTNYAFIVDLETSAINKVNFTGTDSPFEFSRPFLEDSDEILSIKWSN